VAWPTCLDAKRRHYKCQPCERTAAAPANRWLSNGKLVFSGRWRYPGIALYYVRTRAWRNMNGTVEVTLKSDQFSGVDIQVDLGEINPGVSTPGPSSWPEDYLAASTAAMAGQLSLTQAKPAAFGGGQLASRTGRWEFGLSSGHRAAGIGPF